MRELSVVVPVFEAGKWIEETVEKTEAAIRVAGISRYEIIIVDDGSKDDTGRIVANLKKANENVQLITQKNSGRFMARARGVAAAHYDRILFVDARTWINQDSLRFLAKQLQTHPNRKVWNAHIVVQKKGNIIARFGDVVTSLGWRRYFKAPRLTSYGVRDFDHYPKGTGLFCAPTDVIREAIAWFLKTTKDVRNSSDDTLLIRHIAEKEKIWLSPQYSGDYFARTTLPAFTKHTYDRGKFFVDGFLRPGTRFFVPLIVTLIASAVIAVGGWFMLFANITAFGYMIAALVILWLAIFIIVKLLGISWRDSGAFWLLLPLFAVTYLLGIWTAVCDRTLFSGRHAFGRAFQKYRPWLRGTLKEYTVVTLLFILIVIPLTDFVLFHLTHQLFADPGDATDGFLWIDAVNHSINPIAGTSVMANFPFGQNVGGWTLVSYITYWFPMRLISYVTNPVVAINILMLYAYTSSAVAMYWLIKRLTNKRMLAFFAGYAVAFVPYAMEKSVNHFSYIFTAIFPLLIGIFLSLWHRPNYKKAVLFGFLAAVPFYTDGYFMLMAIVLYAAFAIALVVQVCLVRESRYLFWKRVGRIGTALLVFVAFMVPLLLVQKINGQQISSQLQSDRGQISAEITAYRSNVADFYLPPFTSTFLANNSTLKSAHAYNNLRSNFSENNDFISPVLYAFGVVSVVAVGAWVIARKRSSLGQLEAEVRSGIILLVVVCVVAAVLAISIMFSPYVVVHGVRIPLPGELLIKYNISFWRVLSRLFVLFNVLIVILGALGIWLATKDGWKLRGKKISLYVPILVVGTVITVFFYAQSFPTRPYDLSKDLPQTYYWLAKQKDIHSIAEIPVVDPLDTYEGGYVTAQIVDGKDMMNLKQPTDGRLTNTLGTVTNPELINLIKDRGIDAVLLHTFTGCKVLSFGVLIHVENGLSYNNPATNKMQASSICVYKVYKGAADPVFVRFDTGFNPSPNAPDQSAVVMDAGADGWMTMTSDNFDTTYQGDVTLMATIHNTSGLGTGWQLKNAQGQLLQSGSFTQTSDGSVGAIAITLHNTPRVNLVITGSSQPIPLSQVYVDDVVAEPAQ